MALDLGMVAYNSYLAATDGKSAVTGEPLPKWHEQSPAIREAWRAVADGVKMILETPLPTEPGCQHPACVLAHPHAGPAILQASP